MKKNLTDLRNKTKNLLKLLVENFKENSGSVLEATEG